MDGLPEHRSGHHREADVQTDELLIRDCQAGNAAAWETLVRAHQDRMLNLAYQFTGSRDEAWDLAQEIFVRLYLRLDQYDSARPFRAWFNSLARNLCIDHYRARKDERRRVPVPVEELGTLASAGPPPDRRVEQREKREAILAALDTLSDVSREAIVLKDLQEMTLEEIAGLLGLPLGTVKSRVFRARIELGRAIVRLQQSPATSGGGLGLS
jgi:RNA polymerase sigma-70 factor (ECF subfamily)